MVALQDDVWVILVTCFLALVAVAIASDASNQVSGRSCL